MEDQEAGLVAQETNEAPQEASPEFDPKPSSMAKEMASKIPPEREEAFSRVVKAGMKIMFSEKTHQYMVKELSKEGDMAQNIGQAMGGLMILMFEESNRTMPGDVLIPAGSYLLFQGADYLEKTLGEDIPSDVLADAYQVMIETINQSLGIDSNRLYAAADKAAKGGYQ